MTAGVTWENLREECDALDGEATLLTPLLDTRFTITGVQYPRIVIRFDDSGDSHPLQREQFETLIDRVEDAADGFNLDRLPPDANPYVAVLTLHPRFEIDKQDGVIHATDAPTGSQRVRASDESLTTDERAEPDRPVYADLHAVVRCSAWHGRSAQGGG